MIFEFRSLVVNLPYDLDAKSLCLSWLNVKKVKERSKKTLTKVETVQSHFHEYLD